MTSREDSSTLRHYVFKYRKLIGIGLLALVIVDVLEVFPPIFLKQAVDIAVDRRPLEELFRVAAAYMAVALVQGVCRYGWRMYLVRASHLAARDVRGSFVEHLYGLSASFFDRRRVGDLMSLATNDVDSLRTALGPGILVLGDALFYFLTVPIAMFWLSPKLALLAFVPLPVIPWLVMRNERLIHERFERVQESFAKLSAMAQESLSGVRVVKGFAKENVLIERFREAGWEFVEVNLLRARVQTAFGPTLDFTMSVGMVLLLYVGGGAMIGGAGVTLGTFVAFQRFIQKMVWPMAALGMGINHYQRAVTSSDRLKAIENLSTDVPESRRPELPPGHPAGHHVGAPGAPWKTPGAVDFKNLSFRFPGTEEDVLKNVSVAIRPGERVAFVGTIGAGKSALLALLPRLYPVGRGMLLIDGVDVNDWPLEELRRQVGYVSQDVFLFSESVAENVAFGLLGRLSEPSQAPIPLIQEATRLAAVHDDVLGLVGAYGTKLGERGVNLSGGQKQRLTIARALAKEPSILVLDDALSSVDVQTEERILGGLRSRPGRNTEVIAAHRISTIRDSDRIVVLERGEIHQMGTHSELMTDRSGRYRIFYEQQRLKEELETYSESIGAGEEVLT